MTKPFKKHFEISERKILLRIFDVLFVFAFLFFTQVFTDLNYFADLCKNYYWIFVLAIYINLLGTVFEMYNLVVISFANKITKGLLLTSFLLLYFYFHTNYHSFFSKKESRIVFTFFGYFASINRLESSLYLFVGL